MAVNETLTISASMTSVSFDVSMLNDNTLEARNESFNIRIRGIGTTCVISGEDATIVIQDSNSKCFNVFKCNFQFFNFQNVAKEKHSAVSKGRCDEMFMKFVLINDDFYIQR